MFDETADVLERESLDDLVATLKSGVAQAKADGMPVGDASTPEVAPSSDIASTSYAPAVYAIGNFICGRAGVMELTREEAEEIAAPLAICVAEILPEEYVGRYGHWVALIGVLAMVSYPRVIEYREAQTLETEDDNDALPSYSDLGADSERQNGLLPDLG